MKDNEFTDLAMNTVKKFITATKKKRRYPADARVPSAIDAPIRPRDRKGFKPWRPNSTKSNQQK